MTQIDSTVFKSNTATLYADNTTGDISANDLRVQMDNLADSVTFKNTGAIINPTANDDAVGTGGNGIYFTGDIWINETGDSAWICVDDTATAAIWVNITFTGTTSVTKVGTPVDNQLGVWTGNGTLEGDANITWNGTALSIAGNIIVTGTVDGRDVATDGAKLDGIPATATTGITLTDSDVGGLSDTAYTLTTNLIIATGDGLIASSPGAGEVLIAIDNGEVVFDAIDRTFEATDNNSFVTNTGAAGTVRWTIPTGLDNFVVTFYKTVDQPMEIIGATGVTINNAVESGLNETLHTICPKVEDSFVTVYRTGVDTYLIYNGFGVEPVNAQTGTAYTLAAIDRGGIVTMNNAGANTVTIDGATVYTITGISQANPAVVTVADTTGLLTGEVVSIAGVGGMIEITDGDYLVTVIDGTTFSLDGIDSTLYTLYTSGGTATRIPEAYPVGMVLEVIQLGAGATTITAGTGITINGVAGSGTITAQYDVAKLRHVASNVWIASGDIGAIA